MHSHLIGITMATAGRPSFRAPMPLAPIGKRHECFAPALQSAILFPRLTLDAYNQRKQKVLRRSSPLHMTTRINTERKNAAAACITDVCIAAHNGLLSLRNGPALQACAA
mmetsp:Transcript_49979/g.99260  ORF Transcript_49979/g.99260 Transcript_49979/m.99260 type:complete len:110 (+) Transcript_49979:1229-1558(+)